MSWVWLLEYSGEKDFEAQFSFSDEECCDGLVMSAVGAGVEILTCMLCICPTDLA